MKTSFFVEYQSKQVEDKEILTKVKELWVNEGKKIKDIKELNIYIKPEEDAAYYLINGAVSGKVDL